jgi:hypothetical protein
MSYTDEQLLAMALANLGEYIHDIHLSTFQ